MEKIKMFFSWLRNAISPAYVTMFVAAFVLWYITKLGETYTTEHTVVIESLGTEFEADFVVVPFVSFVSFVQIDDKWR